MSLSIIRTEKCPLGKLSWEFGTKPTQRLCSCLSLWPFAGLPLDSESFLWNKLCLSSTLRCASPLKSLQGGHKRVQVLMVASDVLGHLWWF